MRSNLDLAALELDYAKTDALQYLDTQIDQLTRRAEELRRRREDIAVERESSISNITIASYFEWAVNDIENLVRNFNFAEAVRIHGRLHASIKTHAREVEAAGE